MDMPDAGGRQLGRGHRIAHRLAESVGQQERRAHAGDELGVEAPAAVIGEGLGFDQQFVTRCRGLLLLPASPRR